MPRRKKLKPEEIDKLVKKIKAEYRDYIIRYQKPLTVQSGFEHRYLQARRSGMDMETFLGAEIQVIIELKRRETEKQNRNSMEKIYGRPKSPRERAASFADRIMEEHLERIKHYPSLEVHAEAAYEIKKLFGALARFAELYWNDLYYLLQDSAATGYGRFNRDYLSKARDMFTGNAREVPPLLRRYIALLESRDKDWGQIEKEQKRCTIEASFFLHTILSQLDRMEKNEDSYKEAKEYTRKVLQDFRLTDLKPQNL